MPGCCACAGGCDDRRGDACRRDMRSGERVLIRRDRRYVPALFTITRGRGLAARPLPGCTIGDSAPAQPFSESPSACSDRPCLQPSRRFTEIRLDAHRERCAPFRRYRRVACRHRRRALDQARCHAKGRGRRWAARIGSRPRDTPVGGPPTDASSLRARPVHRKDDADRRVGARVCRPCRTDRLDGPTTARRLANPRRCSVLQRDGGAADGSALAQTLSMGARADHRLLGRSVHRGRRRRRGMARW